MLRTPLSEKQLNIASFGRLLALSQEKRYRGPRLDDQTVEGLTRCVAAWLKLNDYKCYVRGNTVRIAFQDGDFIIECAGTHRTDPDYPAPDYPGEFEMRIFNLFGFETWFNENLKNNT